MPSVPRWFVLLSSCALAIPAALVAFTATAGLTRSIAAATVAGAGVAGAVLARLRRNQDANAAIARISPGMRRLFALGAPLLIAQLVFSATFIIDPHVMRWDATWLTPFVLVAPAMISTLTMGNVQLAIIAASMIAMLLFERGRYAAGGVLLAYTIVSKLYPGLLLFYLLLRRDWRALTWTTIAAAAIVIVTIADFGVGPYVAFLTHLPKLLGGEAFPAFRNPAAIAVNESVPGLAFKLQLLGVPHMGFAASEALGWVYTIVVVVLVTRLAHRRVAAGREPLVWLAVLTLATMRSPFLPTYAPFPSLWLATLLAALAWSGGSRVFAASVVAWAVLAFTFGAGGVPPVVNAIWTFMHTVATFAIVTMAVRVAEAPAERHAVDRLAADAAPA